MKRLCRVKSVQLAFSAQCSSKPKTHYALNDDIYLKIHNEELKARKHPGIINTPMSKLPEWILKAIDLCLEDADRTKINKEKTEFANYLFSRRLPTEETDLKRKYIKFEENLLKDKVAELDSEGVEDLRRRSRGKVLKVLKQHVFSWKAIEYNNYKSLVYLVSRAAPEYAVLSKIFNEISIRDKAFKPTTIFDYGSGMGSVLWSIIEKWKTIKEYVGVDISKDFNEISKKIFESSAVKVPGFFHREFLPMSNLKYDVVVSAYSLMELHNARSRLETISKLWKKTTNYLIIVEQGTNAGFQLVNEAREFILHITKTLPDMDEAFVFAPCPHDLSCPRLKAAGDTPCNFIVTYETPKIFGVSKQKNELYSYVVLKKGIRTEEDSWWRLVRPVLVRKKHTICRLCTANGKLVEHLFTKAKSGKTLYKCVKYSEWGHRLPIKDVTEENSASQNIDSQENELRDSSDKESKPNDDINHLQSAAPVAAETNNK